MTSGWPVRGDTVLWTGGESPIVLRVADVYLAEAGGFAVVGAYRPGFDQQSMYCMRRGDISILADGPTRKESACRRRSCRRQAEAVPVRETVLTDQVWARLEPCIPIRRRRSLHPGRLPTGDRPALEGILWVARCRIGWDRLPTSLFGASGATCRRRLNQWCQAGVWPRLHETLLTELRRAGLPELGQALVNSTHLRAFNGDPSVRPDRRRSTGS